MQVPVDYGTGPGTLTTGRQGIPPPPPPPAPEDPATKAARLYANDPIYLMSVAQTKKERADAASAYLEALKPLLLQYGDPALARAVLDKVVPGLTEYLGYTPDLTPYYAQFANSTDPDRSLSTIAQLTRQGREKNTNTTESYNKQNLFYGGHFGKAMRGNAYDLQSALANAKNSIFTQLGTLGQQWLGALNQGQRGDISAASDAYGRSLSDVVSGADSATADRPAPPPPPPPPAPFKGTASASAGAGVGGVVVKRPTRPTPQNKVKRPF